jgi:hypothetical protein
MHVSTDGKVALRDAGFLYRISHPPGNVSKDGWKKITDLKLILKW